ncbi:DUF6018 family natural product bioysynthesis protein [Fictibacillus sp. KIGAM418]|uniref:DUF6018 family natural product bioysynthesis protein n=1 Tax=Fictibacillus marinisediminis TaxID=2878389 RepID=A0A9X1XEX5_9BACL|nr:DUF6018 family natural product bioysynthesis protein [Fictibacillus marinisediminis]MCK6259564.1 DUF6018 family natural product bioysynthesis protein [Fictibacillus marinisediminis]
MFKKMINRRKFVDARDIKTGKVYQFDCRTSDYVRAFREAYTFVKSLEKELDTTLVWRFKGEELYRFGADAYIPVTLTMKLRSFFNDLFELGA